MEPPKSKKKSNVLRRFLNGEKNQASRQLHTAPSLFMNNEINKTVIFELKFIDFIVTMDGS